MPKKLRFIGSSREDLSGFPDDAKTDAGFQLYQVERGLNPAHWRSMPSIGAGVREIRVTVEAGAYRVFYVATFENAIYVLHAFQKTTQQTERRDIDLAKRRYRQVKRIEQARKNH